MRLALGVLLGAAAGVIATTRRSPSGHRPPQPRYDADERGRAAAHCDHKARRHQPDRAEEMERQAQDRAAQQKRAESEERHRRREYRYWWVTGGAAVFATIGTLAAAGFAFGAYKAARESVVAAQETVGETRRQADIGRDAYVASNRAWIDVSVDQSDIALRWREGVGATAYTTLEAVNKGSSPALEVRLSPRLVVDKGMFDASPREVVRRDCKQWWPLNGGDIAFKDERITYTGPAFVPWYEIKVVLDRTAPRDAIEEHVKATGAVPFYFVACAMYRIAGDNEWHHTGRIYRVGRVDDTPDGERASLYLRPGEDLETDRLVLDNPGVGAYAD